MKITEILSEAYGRRYTSYHDELSSLDRDTERGWDQEKRDFKRQELQHELGHERNNIQVSINGKPWKVFAGRGTADSHEEFKHLQHMKSWAAKKSAATGKKWEVHLTGADPTIEETATAGATSAANIGTVDAPHISPGKARGKKSYTGSPSTGSGTKAPPQPKVVQPKTKSGTAVNGLDIKGASLFGGPPQKR